MLNNIIDTLWEIYYSVKANKARAILSGFGISWGILILVVLLGTGKGFQDRVMSMFSVFAQKSMYVYGNATSQKYRNIREGKTVRFDEKYLQMLRNKYPEIVAVSPETYSSQLIKNGNKSNVFNIHGVDAEYMQIRILSIRKEGRLFTPSDDADGRNVAIIGKNVETSLFGNQEALYRQIDIAGNFYLVVGVLKNDDIFSASQSNAVYIPFSNYRRTIHGNPEFQSFCFYLSQNTDSKKFEENLWSYMAHASAFSSDDKQAVFIANMETQTAAFETLFKGIRMFIWGVGICFLISGIAGISNIMFAIVKERTNEIGIRLAVGATPRSILHLILSESVIITTLAGLIGLGAGKGILLLIDRLLSLVGEDIMIQKTELDIQTALAALAVLILSGVIAGSFPAVKASGIAPINAIQYETGG